MSKPTRYLLLLTATILYPALCFPLPFLAVRSSPPRLLPALYIFTTAVDDSPGRPRLSLSSSHSLSLGVTALHSLLPPLPLRRWADVGRIGNTKMDCLYLSLRPSSSHPLPAAPTTLRTEMYNISRYLPLLHTPTLHYSVSPLPRPMFIIPLPGRF